MDHLTSNDVFQKSIETIDQEDCFHEAEKDEKIEDTNS
jgi:hypothetical protein